MAIFKSIRDVLSKTRSVFVKSLDFLRGKTALDENTAEELETLLLKADCGIDTTEVILEQVQKRLHRQAAEVTPVLKEVLSEIVNQHAKPFVIPTKNTPTLILMVGINGAGKTTSIGKLTHWLKAQKKSVLLAAGDTFRAAAISQLNIWAERNKVSIIAQEHGADSASVIFDALQSAYSKKIDVVIADTAGRLQNKQHLMEELKKIARVMKKLDPAAPHEVILVLDASIGQNALQQVKEFNEAVPLTGLIISKLDGTAKGGIIFAIAQKYSVPIYFIGTGESLDDLTPFNPEDFVEGLFDQ